MIDVADHRTAWNTQWTILGAGIDYGTTPVPIDEGPYSLGGRRIMCAVWDFFLGYKSLLVEVLTPYDCPRRL